MAVGTYYGVQYDLAYNTDPPQFTHASWKGKTLTMMDTCETLTATGLDVGTTITMFKPPKGCRWNGIGKIWSDASTANGCTLSVGIAGTVAKFGAATDHGTAAAVMTVLGLAAEIDAVAYEFDGETPVIITTAVDVIDTAVTITLMMQFVAA